MKDYRELLDEIGALLVFVENVKPIDFVDRHSQHVSRLSEDDGVTLVARDHLVWRLVESCGLVEQLPRIPAGYERRYTKTGLRLYPWSKTRVDEWQRYMLHLKSIVLQLTTGDKPTVSAELGIETDASKLLKRVSVDPEAGIVTIDGTPHPINGSKAVKGRVANFIRDLIDAQGEYIARPEDVRTREIEKQPKAVQDLIDSQPGAGSRIPRDKLWLN